MYLYCLGNIINAAVKALNLLQNVFFFCLLIISCEKPKICPMLMFPSKVNYWSRLQITKIIISCKKKLILYVKHQPGTPLHVCTCSQTELLLLRETLVLTSSQWLKRRDSVFYGPWMQILWYGISHISTNTDLLALFTEILYFFFFFSSSLSRAVILMYARLWKERWVYLHYV